METPSPLSICIVNMVIVFAVLIVLHPFTTSRKHKNCQRG